MKERNKIKYSELLIWLKDQLSHPRTLFKRKSWGVFSEYSHIRRSDRRPKIALSSRKKALEVDKNCKNIESMVMLKSKKTKRNTFIIR